MHDKLVKRINELSKKSRTVGLTEEELVEQKNLRKEYIKMFRNGLKNTLNNTYIVDEEGNKKKLIKKNKLN